MNTPTCGEWKPDKYAPLKMLTCYDSTCNAFTDYLGDSGLPNTFAGFVGNFPMPAFLGGWMLLAIIAASMSTGDGAILAMGTVLGHNIMGEFKQTNYSLLIVTRASTALWAIIAAGIASLVPGKTGYLLVVAFDIMFAGCVVPMFAAVYWPSCKPTAAFAAMVMGSLTRLILGLPSRRTLSSSLSARTPKPLPPASTTTPTSRSSPTGTSSPAARTQRTGPPPENRRRARSASSTTGRVSTPSSLPTASSHCSSASSSSPTQALGFPARACAAGRGRRENKRGLEVANA